jgi:hypothetical protein
MRAAFRQTARRRAARTAVHGIRVDEVKEHAWVNGTDLLVIHDAAGSR